MCDSPCVIRHPFLLALPIALAAASPAAFASEAPARECPFCARELIRVTAKEAAAAHYLCGRCSGVVHVHADGRETLSKRVGGRRLAFRPTEDGASPGFPLPGSEGRPVDRPAHPVERPEHPVERPSDPVERPSHPVERPAQPVERPSHPVERADHPVTRPSHAVCLPAHAVKRPGHAVNRPDHAVRRPGHPVTRPGHPVSRFRTRSAPTTLGYKSPIPRSAPPRRAPPARPR